MNSQFERKLEKMEEEAKRLTKAGKLDEAASLMSSIEEARQTVIDLDTRLSDARQHAISKLLNPET
jgi:hypothetical protein